MSKHNTHTIQEWQTIRDAYTGEHTRDCPAVFRIDNTIFSTARLFGGFTFAGHQYRVEYYDDGALLAIRDDFEKWAKIWWKKNMGNSK